MAFLNEAENNWIIWKFWPNQEMRAYTLYTDSKDRNFTSLKTFLIEKGGLLPQVLLPKKNSTM